MEEWVRLQCNGREVCAFYAQPQKVTGTTPSIVLAMHLFGVDVHMRAVAARFAGAGFATIIPDLYAGFDAPNPDEVSDYRQFIPFTRLLSFETVDPAIRASREWLKLRFPAGKTAIAGFCMGGIIASVRTSGYADVFAAAAVWYGLSPKVTAESVDIPIFGSYASEDSGIPVDTVESFRDALRVPHDIVIYPGAKHAFFDDTREAYDRAAAEDSWRRTITSLNTWLR